MNTLQHMRDLVARNRGQATRFVMVDIDAIKDALEWAEQEYQVIAEMHRQANKIRELSAKVAKLEGDNVQIVAYTKTLDGGARKHGEERRRYMANNKALLARNAILEADMEAYQAMYKEDGRKLDLLRHAIRKAPATCRMLGLIK